MVTPTRGPCSAWTPIWCCSLTAANIPLTGSSLMAATEILYNRTAQIFDAGEFTIRPCRDDCAGEGWGAGWGGAWGGFPSWGGSGGGFWPLPANIGGNWYNLTCGSCSGSCSCTPLSQAILPSPVASITSVKLNGTTLPASAYRVDDFRKLIRVDGGEWPLCQDLTKADTEDNTWSVTLVVGETVPSIGQMAVAELACEFMKSCLGQPCSIPRNATAVTRQGVTIDFPTIYDLLDRKLTGLYFVDLFISTYNPHGLQAVPLVYDVDFEAYRRTGTA